jgi:hypothetical protein
MSAGAPLFLRLGLALAFAAAPTLAAAASQPPFEQIDDVDGVVVWKATAADGAPIARATATVEAPLCDVLAIVRDVANHCDWMADCVETRELTRESAFVNELYLRIKGFPWVGVSDRDVVLATRTVRRGDAVEVPFAAVVRPDVTFTDGLVRMPRLEGSYLLTAVGDDRTAVDYRFVVDLGGRVPGWVAQRTVTSLPQRTLAGLRAKAAERRGSFIAVIAAWPPLEGGLPCAPAAD